MERKLWRRPQIAASVFWISGGRWTVFNRLYCPLRGSLRGQYHPSQQLREENDVCERDFTGYYSVWDSHKVPSKSF